jgi:hypothetical protein
VENYSLRILSWWQSGHGCRLVCWHLNRVELNRSKLRIRRLIGLFLVGLPDLSERIGKGLSPLKIQKLEFGETDLIFLGGDVSSEICLFQDVRVLLIWTDATYTSQCGQDDGGNRCQCCSHVSLFPHCRPDCNRQRVQRQLPLTALTQHGGEGENLQGKGEREALCVSRDKTG